MFECEVVCIDGIRRDRDNLKTFVSNIEYLYDQVVKVGTVARIYEL
jgi:hypothetical protein